MAPDVVERSKDALLVKRMRARDESAVVELDALYRSRIQQLAMRYVKTPEDAEEIAQDVLMKVYRRIDAFRGEAALSSWIYRITFNTAMSRLRSRRSVSRYEISEHDLVADVEENGGRVRRETPDWQYMADEALLRGQVRRKLARALPELPTIYRVPVILRDIQGLSTEEASARLGIKEQTLKSRLHRGRAFLRTRLTEFQGGLALHRHGRAPVFAA
ncbi:MAG: sigma-70 family RNA polymerase sigma factor [Acidobacteriota bacterium]